MQCATSSLEFAFDVFTRCQRPVGTIRRVFAGGYRSIPHRHDFPQLWYCHCGTLWHQVGEETYQCTPGSLTIIPIGAQHQFWCEEDVDVIQVNICYDLLRDAGAEQYINLRTNLFLPAYFPKLGLTFVPYRELSGQSRKVAEQVFSWLFLQEHMMNSPQRLEQTLTKLEEFFSIPEYALGKAACKKAVNATQNYLIPILHIVDFLNTHYPANITDEALLQLCNLSRAVMYRHFKQVMQYTYYQYLQHLRAKHAHCLLRDSVYSNGKIASLCGFCSTYHMAQTYTRYLRREIKQQRLYFERRRRNLQDN